MSGLTLELVGIDFARSELQFLGLRNENEGETSAEK